MSLHLRKMMAEQIEEQKRLPVRSLDLLEESLLDTMLEEDPHRQLGALVVITAELLEIGRRADPAYGLRPVS